MKQQSSSNFFIGPYEEFIYLRTYSRFNDELGRRETWPETVGRYIDFMKENLGKKLTEDEYEEVKNAILTHQVMPSMRLLWASGDAARKNAASAYNCSFTVIDNLKRFREILFLLTSGCGVGFSVESQFVDKLPVIEKQTGNKLPIFEIADSREGWADALHAGITAWYDGNDIDFSYEKIRPLGSRLKTFGGRACLPGDTIVYKDRKKTRGYNEISLKQLYEMKNSQGFWEGKANHFNDVSLRSLDEKTGEFFRNKLVDIVDNGDVAVYEILTENGYRIKATDNHRFMQETGEYVELSDFSIGDFIAVNGSPEIKTGVCVDCGDAITRRAMRCKPCFDKTQISDDAKPKTARQRKECQDKKKDACERCGYVGRLVVHHQDENTHNNTEDNLETLCEGCHRKHHFKKWTFGDPYSHKYLSYDRIISVNFIGVERVYDLVMEGPNHNFVANGFVSHNSGPEPLRSLLEYTKIVILNAQGRKLRPIEVHDIATKIAEIVVAGGSRRSSEISLSDLHDEEMRVAKSGNFWEKNIHRTMANNSVSYRVKPTQQEFMREWVALMESGSGERGIFNREGAVNMMPERRREELTTEQRNMIGVNPCSEILLRSAQFCNLTSVVCREDDTEKSLLEKVRIATILGTYQSSLTDFPYLTKIWKDNCDDERLLGVSLNGQYDSPAVRNPKTLQKMREHAVAVNLDYSKRFKIKQSAAVTAVKPEGTGSQMLSCSSGAHPRYAKYYIRRVRISSSDPLFRLMKDQGVPYHPENGQTAESATTFVLEFPIKSPDDAITRHDVNAVDQLEYWKLLKQNYAEHTVSMTVYVGRDEWIRVANWVWDNWDSVSGISFLPREDSEHVYVLAPYQEITEDEYKKMADTFPKIDFSVLSTYEAEDATQGAKELACGGGTCEII